MKSNFFFQLGSYIGGIHQSHDVYGIGVVWYWYEDSQRQAQLNLIKQLKSYNEVNCKSNYSTPTIFVLDGKAVNRVIQLSALTSSTLSHQILQGFEPSMGFQPSSKGRNCNYAIVHTKLNKL